MEKHTPLELYNQAAAKVAAAASKQVIVNTSGSNTAYLPSPETMATPTGTKQG